MNNNVLFIELLKSNVCRNLIDSAATSTPFKYSLKEGLEDGVNIGKAIAEANSSPCSQCNNFNTECQQKRVQLAFEVFDLYFKNIDMGPSSLDFDAGFRIGVIISENLAKAKSESALNLIAENLKTEIKAIQSFTQADRYNLQVFVLCMAHLYAYDLKNGVSHGR